MSKLKLTGGYKGYQKAVREGFASDMSDPTVRYSHARGFHVEPRLFNSDKDVLWQQQCYYNLNNGGAKSPKPTKLGYKTVREEIMDMITTFEGEET